MRNFDIRVRDYNLAQYWSSLSTRTNTFLNAPNVLPNPELDNGATGYTPSNNGIINFITNSEGNKVFRIKPTGTAVAIRSTAIQPTVAGEDWYFECRVRATKPITVIGNLSITAETFNDGASAINAIVPGSLVTTNLLTTEWRVISGIYKIPSPKNGVKIRVFLDQAPNDGEIEVDSFKMRRKNGVMLDSQTGGLSGLAFTYDPVINNRNITSDSVNSILIGANTGIFASANPFSDIQLSMLLYPNVSDTWIIKLPHALDIGVRIDAGGVMTLAYPVEGVVVEETITYDEQVSYFMFSVIGSAASIVLNEKSISIEGDFLSFGQVQFGGGTGSALIDKIAISFVGNLPLPRDYAKLFKSVRLDTVPRPYGAASFAYLSDTLKPYVEYLDAEDFNYDNGFYYSHARNTLASARTAIVKRAPFAVDYSIDQMTTWLPLNAETYIPDTVSEVIFRHSEENAFDYSIDVMFTDSTVDPMIMPLADFDVSAIGSVYLNEEYGTGYYDTETAYFGIGSIYLEDEYDDAYADVRAGIDIAGTVRSVEVLIEFNNSNTAFLTTDIVSTKTYYVNGVLCPDLSVLKSNQVYHIIAVLSVPAAVATISGEIRLAGLGASDMAYTAEDARNIFGTFAGNTLIDALEEIKTAKDGIHPNSDDNLPGIVYDLQWNS